ncbi:PIN domain-containing protein [Robinsoniella peoriensis]
MNNLKKFYEEVEKNAELKKELVILNKEVEGKEIEAIKAKLIETAKKYGFSLCEADFNAEEGELNLDDLKTVAGGAGGCFISNSGCSLFGDMPTYGCIIIGAYV